MMTTDHDDALAADLLPMPRRSVLKATEAMAIAQVAGITMTLGDYELAPNLSNAEKPADNKYQKTDSIVSEFEPAFAAPPYSPQVAF